MFIRRYVGGLAPPSSAVVAIARSLISMYNLRSRSIYHHKISNKQESTKSILPPRQVLIGGAYSQTLTPPRLAWKDVSLQRRLILEGDIGGRQRRAPYRFTRAAERALYISAGAIGGRPTDSRGRLRGRCGLADLADDAGRLPRPTKIVGERGDRSGGQMGRGWLKPVHSPPRSSWRWPGPSGCLRKPQAPNR